MHFCPFCKSLLLPEMAKQLHLNCPSCPYTYKLSTTLTISRINPTKPIDTALDSPDDLQYASTCTAKCPKCMNEKALFLELQTRSADEPTTIFYKCTKCHFDWKE